MIRHALIIAIGLGCGGGAAKPVGVPPAQPSSPVAEDARSAEVAPSQLSTVESQKLREALATMDETSPASVEAAVEAADAIGEHRVAVALPELAGLIARPPTKKLVMAQVAAIRAVGTLDRDADRAAAILAGVIERPVARPRDKSAERPARSSAEGAAKSIDKADRERWELALVTAGAAINALGELRTPAAIATLVPALYRMPELMQQLRRAIVASGPDAIDVLRKILRGEHAQVEALLRAGAGRYCGDLSERPANQCQPVSARDFYAAIVLGDLRASRALPELLAMLERPGLPAYYLDDQPGPTQHTAALDALRKIGSPGAAAKLRALWTKPGVDLATRAAAIGTYAVVATDATAVDELGKIAADNAADDTLRQEAATAFARLGREPKHIQLVLELAKKYLDASAKQRTEAKKLEAAAAAADAVFDKVKLAHDAARAKVVAIIDDANASADQIRAATAAAKQTEAVWKAAKQVHREKVAPFKQASSAAEAYLGFARMFQAHAARIEIAIRCHDDACLTASLQLTGDAAAKQAAAYIPDAPTWPAANKVALVEAYVDRAMLELGKRGTKASAATDALLDALKSESRNVRQALVIALPRLAVLPCPTCVTKLDATLQVSDARIGDQKLETEILRNYFRWAK